MRLKRTSNFWKERGLDTGVTVYVPSTTNEFEPISKMERERRIREVVNFMKGLFGGTTLTEGEGTWVASKYRTVEEKVALVKAFASYHDWKLARNDLARFLKAKRVEWKQKTISVELESPKHRNARMYFLH